MSLFKNLVNQLIMSSNYPNEIKLDLKNQLDNLNSELALQFTAPENTVLKLESKLVKDYELNKLILQRLELHDGTYIDVFSNSAVEHYSASDVLIGNIPFSFNDVDFFTLHGYANPTNACVVNTKVGNTDVSFLLVLMTGGHCVQVYKYASRVWSYFASIGNPDTPGETTGLLYNPLSIAAYFKNTLKVAVSCLGEDEDNPHIKLFTITEGDSQENQKILYSGYSSQQPQFENKLEGDEVSAVPYMSYSEKYLTVVSDDQFGTFDIDVDFNAEKPRVIQMVNDTFRKNDFDENLGIPKSFLIDSGFILAGDSAGHLFRVSFADFSAIDLYTGTQGGDLSSKNRPGFNDQIISVSKVGGKINYITRNAVYESNLNIIPNGKTVSFEISKPSKNIKIVSYAGFTNKELKVRFGGKTQTFEEAIINQDVVSYDDTLEVVITSDLNSMVKGDWEIYNGLIIVEVV